MFESNASNKSLRIRDGVVEGTGGRGLLAQFTVHVRRPGVVTLQNVKNPDQYLAIYEGSTNGVVCCNSNNYCTCCIAIGNANNNCTSFSW